MSSNCFVIELDRLLELALVLQCFGSVVVMHELLSPLSFLGGHLHGGYRGWVALIHHLAAQNILPLARLAIDLCVRDYGRETPRYIDIIFASWAQRKRTR